VAVRARMHVHNCSSSARIQEEQCKRTHGECEGVVVHVCKSGSASAHMVSVKVWWCMCARVAVQVHSSRSVRVKTGEAVHMYRGSSACVCPRGQLGAVPESWQQACVQASVCLFLRLRWPAKTVTGTWR